MRKYPNHFPRHNVKGELKSRILISLYDTNTYTSRIGCCPPFSFSDSMRGEFCLLPAQHLLAIVKNVRNPYTNECIL